MHLIYTTKKYLFSTPEELQTKMIEYLEYCQKQNEPYAISFCKNCGTMNSKGDCCDNPDLQHKMMTKASYEMLRPTIFGLSAFCGMGSTSLYKYVDIPGFDEVIEWFKIVLQMDLEQLLLNPFNRNVAGAKFVAINNFGWKDKAEIEHSGIAPVTFIDDVSVKRIEPTLSEEDEQKWLK